MHTPVGRAFDRVSLSVAGQHSSSGNSASGNLLCLWFLFGNHTFAVRAVKIKQIKFAAKSSAAIVAMKKTNDRNRARTTIRK